MDTKKLSAKQNLSKLNPIWLLPLIALIFTIILIWDNTINKGPKILLKISSAEGIVEGTTLVKMRSVPVGRVIDVSLDENYENAVLTVQMEPETDNLLKDDSIFWVVKPRVENTGVSGLDTLLSGPYIEMQNGVSSTYSESFEVLEEPPSNRYKEKGIYISLKAKEGTKLNNNDIVTYKGINVGSVVSSEFDFKDKVLSYKVFIKEPYSSLLTKGTRFWIYSGIDISFGAEGFQLATDSLDNIIKGGIAFDNLNENQTQPLNLNHYLSLPLYSNKSKAQLSTLENALQYVVMIKDSVNGIKLSSPVSFKGITIGKVINSNYFKDGILDLVSDNKYIPILVGLDINDENKDKVASIFDKHLKRGTLCASIDVANILTGDKKITLNYSDVKCRSYTKTYRGIKVIPISSNSDYKERIDNILANIEKLDLNGISNDLKKALQSTSKAMDSIKVNSSNINKTQVIENINEAFKNFNKTIKNYGPDSDVGRSIEELSIQLNTLLNDLSPAINKVSSNPSSIIFGDKTKDIEPLKE